MAACVHAEPVPPLDFLGIAFHTNSSARRWAAAFVVRRLVVVVTVVFIKFWPVQVRIAWKWREGMQS